MKAVIMHTRPAFDLLKQSDVVTYYHLQFPCWLFDDERYAAMGLVAKTVYMLLFNRFQLLKLNGWMNGNGEVFVIYTRKELSEKLRVSEKLIKDAMDELKGHSLVWERRCGRGYANQIYLSRVTVSQENAVNSKGGPFDPLPPEVLNPDDNDDDVDSEDLEIESRPDEIAGLDFCKELLRKKDDAKKPDNINNSTGLSSQEAPEPLFKNRQNDGSRTAEKAVQEPPNRRPSYIDIKINKNEYESSQSKSCRQNPFAAAPGMDVDRLTDAHALEEIFIQAELDYFEDDEAAVIKDAIERLYYSESIRIQDAIYPSTRIRSNLLRLDSMIVQDALHRLARNEEKIRNSSAYVKVVLFNTIMESGSDLLVDPYLNHLRRGSISGTVSGGDRGP